MTSLSIPEVILKVFFSKGGIKKDRGCILCYGRFNLELKKKILSDE